MVWYLFIYLLLFFLHSIKQFHFQRWRRQQTTTNNWTFENSHRKQFISNPFISFEVVFLFVLSSKYTQTSLFIGTRIYYIDSKNLHGHISILNFAVLLSHSLDTVFILRILSPFLSPCLFVSYFISNSKLWAVFFFLLMIFIHLCEPKRKTRIIKSPKLYTVKYNCVPQEHFGWWTQKWTLSYQTQSSIHTHKHSHENLL